MLHLSPSNSAPPTLPELLDACVRQDRVAQRRLYGQFHGFAMGICLRYARDRDQALEAANDGFLKVFRDVSRFDAARHPADVLGSFRGWLKRIMIHTAIDHHRARFDQLLQVPARELRHQQRQRPVEPLTVLRRADRKRPQLARFAVGTGVVSVVQQALRGGLGGGGRYNQVAVFKKVSCDG